MINKIRIENYKGISKSREISFIANSKRKADKSGITKVMKKEVLLSVALMGKNASGKSSFVDGIDFIQTLAYGLLYKNFFQRLDRMYHRKNRNREMNTDKIIDIKPKFVMNLILKEEFNDLEKPIKLFIEFIDSNNIIGLSIELSTAGIVKEVITKNNKIYSKQEENIESFKSNIFEKNLIFKRVVFLPVHTIFDEMLAVYVNWGKYFKNKKINRDIAFQWIRLADNKIKRIIWTSKDQIEGFVINHENSEKIISHSELSSGTKKWLSIGQKLFYAFYIKQSFIFVDELDRTLHPSLSKLLITLINDLKVNKKRSQMFFTSHSPLVVEKPFRKDAINYIDRSGNIINLGSLGMREDLSIAKNFLSEKLSSHPIKSDIFELLGDLYD